MKKTIFRRGLSLTLALLLCVPLALPALAEEGGGAPPSLTGISLSMGPGGEIDLSSVSQLNSSVTPIPANAVLPTDLIYTWSSNDPAVATVSTGSTTATVNALAIGRATITLTVTSPGSPGITATATQAVLSSGITMSPTSLTMKVRESQKLTPNVFVPTGTDASLVWSSSSDNVVTVDTSGSIRALSAGDATITATAQNGTYSASCQISVSDIIADVITDSATADTPLAFSYLSGQIDAQCRKVLGTSLAFVTSLSVPTAAGTLYYGYISESERGSGVGTNENYHYSGSGTLHLSDVTFVPKPAFSGNAVISYTGYDTAGAFFQGTIRVSIAAVSGISYSTVGRNRVDFSVDDFSAICQARTGHELQSVTFSLPSSSRGMLFYNYSGSDLDNKVTSTTPYYRSKTPSLSNVTFVAADGYSGTVNISYQGRDTNANSFSGEVSITVSSGTSGKGSIAYSTNRNRSVRFNASDFDDLCRRQTDANLRYVRFTLPASSQGTLYYNYSSSSNTVSPSTSYYRNSSPYLDEISFSPASGYTGTVTISFTGYSTTDVRLSGTVTITVGGSTSSDGLTYSTNRNTAARFDADDFDDYCRDRTGNHLNYVRFSLPSSSRGTLYYNYSSSGSNSSVSDSSSYYRSSSPYLDNISFLPASDFVGTEDISFTGYADGGERFTGTVRITVKDGASTSGVVAYSTAQDTALNFVSGDFDDLCRDKTGAQLNYVRFIQPPSSKGALYYNYSSSSSTSNKISDSTSYYRNSSPYLNNITFVPASGYTGTTDIEFTGYSTDGQRFTGTVRITVKTPTAAGIIYYTTSAGAAVKLQLSSFQNACSARGAGSFSSATFYAPPPSSAGQLRLNYVSASQPGTAISSSASYQASGSPLLSDVSFVPSAGYSGTQTFSYTGRDNKGANYSGSVVVTVTADTKGSFTDMGNSAWAVSSVEYLYSNGVVYGTGNGKFSPNAAITRGSFMLMLDRAFDFTASPGSGFSDLPSDSVYADAVKTAQALGIAQGSGSKFFPKDPMSRQQAAVFLTRALRADGWTIADGTRSNLSGFSDSGAVSDYAVGAMSAMVKMNIFQGNKGKLNPQSPLTRAQMSVILCRAMTM